MGAPRRSEAGRGHRDRAVQEDFSKEGVFEQKPGEAREQAEECLFQAEGAASSQPLRWGCVGTYEETSASGSQAGGEWEEQRPQREEALATQLCRPP